MSPEKNAVDYSVSTAAPPHTSELTILRGTVPAALAGQRLDVVLARMFSDYSRTRFQRWLRDARVRVDGVAAQPQAIPLHIVFEDDALLVIDKPAGWVVHPGSGNRDGTPMNARLHAVPAL